MTKKPRVTRKQKKADAMYKANPTWAAEDNYTPKMKTGGMVNSNAKVSAAKAATGKVGGVSKAISKTAVNSASPKGNVGGISKAPTKALPKAQLGAIIKTAKTAGKAITTAQRDLKAANYVKQLDKARGVKATAEAKKVNTLSKIANAPGGKTVIGGTLASGIAGLNRLSTPGNAKVAGKGMASKVASKANKQKMGGSMKGKSC